MKKLFTLFCLFTFIHLSVNIKAQDSSNFPFSDNINIENFVITSKVLSNNRIDFKFDIIGKYQRLDMAIYVGNTNDTSLYSTNRICTIYWNDDKDEPIYYPEKITRPFWHGAINSKYNNHVISGKYFLVIDYWYNGVKKTKTLEYNKEEVKNNFVLTKVRLYEDGKELNISPSWTYLTLFPKRYQLQITVSNRGSHEVENLKFEVRGTHKNGREHFVQTYNNHIPKIPKGNYTVVMVDLDIPYTKQFNEGLKTLDNLLRIKLDPSNELNSFEKSAWDIKYDFWNKQKDFKSSLSEIEVYNSSGNKIKSTAVNDLEKGVQEIKKSLPKGHYYFNIDGEKTQVKIQ